MHGWLLDYGVCAAEVSGFGFRVPGFGFRVPGFGFRIPGFEVRVSDSGSGSGVRVDFSAEFGTRVVS